MWNLSLICAPVVVDEPGYHVNLPTNLVTSEMIPFLVHPVTPENVFLGVDTSFLKFADENQARSILADYWIES